jgi:hypothetical protein
MKDLFIVVKKAEPEMSDSMSKKSSLIHCFRASDTAVMHAKSCDILALAFSRDFAFTTSRQHLYLS